MQENERITTDSNLLRTFVEIAECQNLTLAAARLNRSQSAISVQVKKLEMELNSSLFIREGKGMSLSADGEKLLPAARSVLAELIKVQTLFEDPLNGRIRVGIPDDLDEGVLERALADFSQSNPGVEVFARSGCTASFPDAIGKGEIDIAVICGPDDLGGESLRPQKPVWVASKAMPISPADPIPLAVINHQCWMGLLPKRSLDEMGRAYTVSFECSGLMSLKAAIRSGFAIGIVNENVVEPEMRILTTKDGFPPLPIAKRAVMVRADAPSDLTKAMVRAIQRAV